MRRARLVAGLALVAAVASTHPARADERVECAHAYEQTQRLRQKGDVFGALDEAQRCARASCPQLLQQECVQWATEIQSKLPSLTTRVIGSDGCTRPNPILEISGNHRSVASGAMVLDPGVHEIRVVDPASGRVKTETIDFAEGERRDIDIDFAQGATCGADRAPAPPAPPVKERRKIPLASFVLGGIGGGLLLTGATLGIVGASKRSDLDDCKPSCSSDRIDGVRTFFVAGDVLGGVGLLAIGAGVVVYLLTAPSGAASGARSPGVVAF